MPEPKVSLDRAIEAYKRYKSRKPIPVKVKPVKREEESSETGSDHIAHRP